LSLHPIMTTEELLFICDSIKQVALHYEKWQNDYQYNRCSNEYENLDSTESIEEEVKEWFELH